MNLFSLMPGGWYKAINALVAGDVTVGEGSSFWFNAMARGDVASITIGNNVNVQDASIIHCDAGEPCVIADNVTIGHRAVIHGLEIGPGSLIGIGAIVLQRARIGAQCLIGAGAVVPPGLVVPDRSVVLGIPGKIVRSIRDEEIDHIRQTTQHYTNLARRYAQGEFTAQSEAKQVDAIER